MTLRFALLVPILCLAAASRFTTAELQQHRDWMDDAQDRKEDVREALAAKDVKKLLAAAEAIEQLTRREQDFWARTDIKQAREIAARNREEAKEMVGASTGAPRFDAATDAFARLEKTCSFCHDLHFEKNGELASAGQ